MGILRGLGEVAITHPLRDTVSNHCLLFHVVSLYLTASHRLVWLCFREVDKAGFVILVNLRSISTFSQGEASSTAPRRQRPLCRQGWRSAPVEGKPGLGKGRGGAKPRGSFCLKERKNILASQRVLKMELSPCGKLFKTCSEWPPTAESQKCRGGAVRGAGPTLSLGLEWGGFLVIKASSCI